ncbi:mechanosensitive ion channel domain-containing protein [Tundrisphaera lichenicola]|uniref:mechanosensitive ion channel domain-containing protein n=1 Tax=Tundrisphaera lichenicola TaxID=2029860 RepID=UPI003EB89ABF
MREVRRFLIGLGAAAIWPAYLALVAYALMEGPWPRDLAWPASVLMLGLAGSLFVVNSGRMAFRKRGWAEEVLLAPEDVTRQCRRVVLTIAIAGFVLVMPEVLLGGGLIAPEGRPISATALGRLLILGFELTCWILAYRLLRPTSPLLLWLAQEPERLGWAGKHLRHLAWATLSALSLVLILDAAGFRFSSKRLLYGGVLSLVLTGTCWVAHRLLLRLIDQHAWRWKKATGNSAVSLSKPETQVSDDAGAKLRTLARALVLLVGLLGGAWIWNVDLALFRYIAGQSLWTVGEQTVNVGDFVRMMIVAFVTFGAWRYLNTFFTVVIFPRMTEDPGVRYAVVTLCRYAVLALGSMAGLSSIHMGMERIGVVLAALGVGLGFGLQEIVANFVSGIILLLERPIRLNDLVTVGGMTGRVDRIDIRATTIINGDNQSMIIPNRAFITGNLVNWTHRDKIIRVVLNIQVAHGTDADKVTDLLLAIAHEDPDVLNNPVSTAFLDSVGESSLHFIFYAFVPDPSLLARVRHRLYGQIQRRFAAAGITIPLPTREVRLQTLAPEPVIQAIPRPHVRAHEGHAPQPVISAPIIRPPLPKPAEPSHRGMDE